MATDGVDGPEGQLKGTKAAVTRFRTGLEGSRGYTLGGRMSLTPSVEVGLRHDGGDAETGAGMDVGAGLVVSDPSMGLSVDVRVRTLLVHQAEGFRERGVALSLSYNQTPSTLLGFVARVKPSCTPRRRHVRRAVLLCPEPGRGRCRPHLGRARLHGARRRELRVLSEPVGDKHAAQSS